LGDALDKPATGNLIAYRWALDETGRPVPITVAQRGRRYSCPLCRGLMVARLGEQLQHHFGHESDAGCTPEAVTRAAVRRWVTIQLREALIHHRIIKLSWKCPRCNNNHSANLLEGVSQVAEGYLWDGYFADVGMLDTAGNILGVIMVQDELVPTPETLRFFREKDIFTLLIPASITPAGSDFDTLVRYSQQVGGPCPVLEQATNIIQDPETIRQTLRDVVARWPGYFYGPLETIDRLAHVLRIGNHALWLPPERWRDIVGGTRNPLAPGVQVIMQTWPHSDGGQIWLYYAIVRETEAVGVRRYGPGQTPVAYIDARFRSRNVSALDVVRFLVTQK
jgi:hypothetical protein